jgi:hypothetical protein
MCACKETDVKESPNNTTLAGEEGQGSHGEMCHPIYRESPVSSVAEHPFISWWHGLHALITQKATLRGVVSFW